jgi:MOSC domain-containing protein YiiM
VKLISVNVGLPIKVKFGNEIVTTGIFKNPVDKRINLKKLNLEGDRQADLTVHGGPDKAVYSYPYGYYDFMIFGKKSFQIYHLTGECLEKI